MGKEVKISLAAVGVLALILIAVLGRGLLRSGGSAPEDGEKEIAASGSDASTAADAGSSPKDGSSAKSTASAHDLFALEKPKVIPAHSTQTTSQTPGKDSTGSAGSFTFVSDDTSDKTPSPGPPSFMPKGPQLEETADETADTTAAEPYRAPAYNPFPTARGGDLTAVPRPPASAPVRREEPSLSSPSAALLPNQRYGANAGETTSREGGYSSGYDNRGVPDYRDTRQEEPAESVPAYKPGGSPYRTRDDSNTGARFQPTSDPGGTSYRPASSSGTGGSYALPGMSPSPAVDGKLTVQPNDSFWKISQRLYGSGAYFQALAEHNRDVCPNPHRLRAGTVIEAPDSAVLREKYPDLCPTEQKEEMQRRRASVDSTAHGSTSGRVYIVQAGDTLYDIARYELEDASRWGEIVALNRNQLGDDYDYLVPGMKLVLPTGAGESVQPAQLSRPSIQTATPPQTDAFRRY